jgi:hypothetical protein
MISALVSQMNIHLARTEAIEEEIIAKIYARQERMEAKMNAWQEGSKACLERKGPTTVRMANVVGHIEGFNRVMCKETVWATDDKSRDLCLAIRNRVWPKKWTQGDGGSRQK